MKVVSSDNIVAEYKDAAIVYTERPDEVILTEQECYRCKVVYGLSKDDVVIHEYTHMFLWDCPLCRQKNASFVVKVDPNGNYVAKQGGRKPKYDGDNHSRKRAHQKYIEQMIKHMAEEVDPIVNEPIKTPLPPKMESETELNNFDEVDLRRRREELHQRVMEINNAQRQGKQPPNPLLLFLILLFILFAIGIASNLFL